MVQAAENLDPEGLDGTSAAARLAHIMRSLDHRLDPEWAAHYRLLEGQHRIRNQLQLLSSMLELQARRCEHAEAAAVLRAAQGRIHAIARLQRWVETEGGRDSVDLGAFLSGYCEDLAVALGLDDASEHKPRLAVSIAPSEVSARAAIMLALITGELVTNSVKHAGADVIWISWSEELGEWRLTVADDGAEGLPPDAFDTAGGLGAQLIKLLSASLHGVLQVGSPEHGASISVTFEPAAVAVSAAKS